MADNLQSLFDAWVKAWSAPASATGASPNPLTTDPRFKDPAWANTPYGQSLLTWYQLAGKIASQVGGLGANLPAHQKRVWDFYVNYAVDALAPSNFFWTNPQALQKAAETRGHSVATGALRMLSDLQRNALPASTDKATFKVGGNLANTPGSVVFQNEIFQLIQYTPRAAQVHAVPLLIVPPCVNKFYAFDLNENKSMVRWLLEQGHNVFMVSWRNPHANSTDHGWEDYVFDGVIAAVDAACDIGKSPRLNLMAWCIGGALSVSALAVMTPAEKKKIASATFLTTLVDYSDPGDVEIFVDQQQISAFTPRVRSRGVMPGQDLAKAMAMLHANDSIWNFWVSNYLLGDNIPPFDVLFWNSDTANVPGELYQFYVENMYWKNLLREPGALSLRGRKVDVGNLDMPVCFVSATEDHIVPWKTTLAALELVGGEVDFMLTEGGHVSGTIINHPAKTRKSHWVNGPKTTDPDAWLAGAEKRAGSWWTGWHDWAAAHAGKKVAAPKTLGNAQHKPIEPAPGSYVLEEVPQS